jgi:hypothetical protein
MQLRDKWRPLFAEELRRRRAEKLRQDVIIHDVARPNTYPGDDDEGRISSWFKVALVGQYHKGIEVGLRIHSLVWEESEQSWRLAALEGETGDRVTAYLVGYIPYESIVSVNWDGDEYYGHPHIFCHFEYAGQPYERLAFCERRELSHGQEYFSELEDHDRVRLTSEKFGTAWEWRPSS